ncbi:MAG: serpin family protein [Lachnospiraceae bacterium]|nr:serpin family protein [Lachnospiraceae bacterium]
MEKMLITITAIIMLVVIAVSTTGCAGDSASNAAQNAEPDGALRDAGIKPDGALNGAKTEPYDKEDTRDVDIVPVNILANDLMEGVEGQEVNSNYLWGDYEPGMTEFALRLAKACNESDAGQNVLVSPLSVLMALSMTANGAEGTTLARMEEALGFPIDMLNAYAYLFNKKLQEIPSNAGKLEVGNSIWFANDPQLIVNKDFLQTNADYYGAEIYSAPFDHTTVSSINSWVKEKTKGMIPRIIDNIDPSDLMVLVNAVAFEAKWSHPYIERQVENGVFHVSSDEKRIIPFMHGSEHSFLSDDNAQGFIKEYKGRKYAFAALLPDEGTDVDDYLKSLSGERLNKILNDAEECYIVTSIPKFESEYDVELRKVLSDMGMGEAFSYDAEFGNIGKCSNNFYIRKVQHKTFISVDENGTKAGAATAVMAGGTGGTPKEKHEVNLDRPFVYMLIDMETKTPFFIGIMRDPALKD